MRRTAIAHVVAVGLLALGSASDASAYEPVEAPRSVHVRVRAVQDNDVADVFLERRGTWSFECRAPCTFDAAPGEHGRIDIYGSVEPPLTFTVPATTTNGDEHVIEVRHKGRGFFVGGLVAFGAGAVSLALGMAIIRGAGREDLFGEANPAMGRILLVLGAGSAVTGAVLVLTRSTAPILATPSNRTQALEDLSPSRAVVIGTPVLPPEFVWTRRF